MPEDYEEFISLTLRIKNSKKPLKMLARNRKHQWLPLCLARQARRVSVERPVQNQWDHIETFVHLGSQWIHKTAYGRLSTKSSWGPCCRKGRQLTTTLQFGSQISSYASRIEKFQQQKQQWTRNGKNLRKFRRGTWRKSEVKNRWSMKQGRRALQFILPHWWTYVIWRMPNWRQITKSTKVELYSEATLWKMILDLTRYSLNRDHQYLKWQPPKSWIPSPDCHVAQAADAASAFSQVKMEDAPKLLKIPKSECPDIWIRPPRHKWPKSRSSMEDPVVPLERNLYGHPWAGLLWERQFEKIMLKYGWEKVSNWECLFRTPWKRIVLICVCGWHEIGWKET